MTCAACQARVQGALASEPGVIDASVNLLTKSAAVRYDSAAVSPARLIEAVRATGYEAELPTADESPARAMSRRENADERERPDLRPEEMVVRIVLPALRGVVRAREADDARPEDPPEEPSENTD